MDHDSGYGFRIRFDTPNGTLRVIENVTPIKGFHPIWEEVAAFNNPASWEQSPYATRVSDAIREMIEWFWIDTDPAVIKQLAESSKD